MRRNYGWAIYISIFHTSMIIILRVNAMVEKKHVFVSAYFFKLMWLMKYSTNRNGQEIYSLLNTLYSLLDKGFYR